MKMNRIMGALCLLPLVIVACGKEDSGAKLRDGVWEVTQVTDDGVNAPKSEGLGGRLIVTGDKVAIVTALPSAPRQGSQRPGTIVDDKSQEAKLTAVTQESARIEVTSGPKPVVLTLKRVAEATDVGAGVNRAPIEGKYRPNMLNGFVVAAPRAINDIAPSAPFVEIKIDALGQVEVVTTGPFVAAGTVESRGAVSTPNQLTLAVGRARKKADFTIASYDGRALKLIANDGSPFVLNLVRQ